MARGRATSATSMRKRVSDRLLLLRRLQRSHIALLPPGDPAEQPGQRSIAVHPCRIFPVDRIGHQMPLLRPRAPIIDAADRSEEHTSELQSLMRISYAVFCLTKKTKQKKKKEAKN